MGRRIDIFSAIMTNVSNERCLTIGTSAHSRDVSNNSVVSICCVDDSNYVHYIAHIFWSRYAHSGKHHAMPVNSYVTTFQFQNHHPTGQQKDSVSKIICILIFRKLTISNLHLYRECVNAGYEHLSVPLPCIRS